MKLGRQCMEDKQKVLGPKHPETIRMVETYARYLEAAGRHKDAKKVWSKIGSTVDRRRAILEPCRTGRHEEGRRSIESLIAQRIPGVLHIVLHIACH